MHNRTRIAVIIISVGALVSIVIAARSPAAGEGRVSATLTTQPAAPNPLFQFQGGAAVPGAPPSVAGAATEPRGSDNLTQQLIASYLNEVANQNPRGPGTGGAITVPGATVITDLIAREAGGAPSSPAFARTDIRVGTNDSREAQRAYLISIKETLDRQFGSLERMDVMSGLREFFEAHQTTILEKLSKASFQTVGGLLSLAAPPTLASFHLDLINTAGEMQAWYDALIHYTDDPLRAYLAVQSLESIVTRTVSLNTAFLNYYNALMP